MDVDADTVITAARRYPMMAERQLVVVKEAQNMKSLDQLSIYCENPLDSTILVILLDHSTLVPLVMAVLLSMLQDRRRPLWLWLLVQVPVVTFGVMGIVRRDWFYGYTLPHYWQLGTIAVFVIYYVFALRRYGRWLLDNYADLEHKEVWQSLTFAVVLFAVYSLYTSNMGEMAREYLSQVITLVIIAFLVWRVETLQEMKSEEEMI